ncbi:uncharacterized protein E0L32_003825 [Thyridium curvatum]|uniref:Uncharacterized protein n=1 Tax=Thyridium curvatum TaxID=1093900 RepID=A0A507BHQ9_9PEZI|nr:uncharacterized protein E0L32_003825 [Thyridium curvatum]TPX16531.1 hypothetical protein E0L32_003825 [Thyridium curvatum]
MSLTKLVSAVLLASVAGLAAAAVTILPGGQAKPYRGPAGPLTADAFYRESAANDLFDDSVQVLIGSVDDGLFADPAAAQQILPSSESFVRGTIRAWAEHLHLVVRPEEVWFSVLSQLNAYMDAHAGEVAGVYVNHRGGGGEPMTLDEYDYFRLMEVFKREMELRAKVPWFSDWAFTNLTTTNANDYMNVAVLLLGEPRAAAPAAQPKIACGLPSVTLVGEQSDWADVLAKLDRFEAFGPEVAAYGARLRPILTRFVSSYTESDSPETRRFWNQIVSASPATSANAAGNASCSASETRVSGWITGFVHWDLEGKILASAAASDSAAATPELTLDGTTYQTISLQELPIGYARAPFLLHDFNDTQRYEAYVVAGTMGQQISTGPPDGYAGALRRANMSSAGFNASQHSTLQAMSAWALYGPANHSAPGRPWVEGSELVDLAASVRKSVKSNSTLCNVV